MDVLCFTLKAVILEGRYWRRKLEAVAREYKKLRIYYKKVCELCLLALDLHVTFPHDVHAFPRKQEVRTLKLIRWKLLS